MGFIFEYNFPAALKTSAVSMQHNKIKLQKWHENASAMAVFQSVFKMCEGRKPEGVNEHSSQNMSLRMTIKEEIKQPK